MPNKHEPTRLVSMVLTTSHHGLKCAAALAVTSVVAAFLRRVGVEGILKFPHYMRENRHNNMQHAHN